MPGLPDLLAEAPAGERSLLELRATWHSLRERDDACTGSQRDEVTVLRKREPEVTFTG